MGVAEYTEEDLARGARDADADFSASAIQAQIARKWGLTVEQLRSRIRYPTYVAARRELYAMLKAHGWSYPRIGKFIGRDHTTIEMALKPDAKRAKYLRRKLRAAE